MAAARKKRILVCGELSTLSTGYSRIGFNILKHLAATGKYELAEMANYCMPMDLMAQRDPRNFQIIQKEVEWKIFPVMPYEEEANLYNSNPMNQFGAYRYNDVLMDFRPDLVFSCLDVWMTLHLFRSPFREFYNLILMPAIDGVPQQPEWIQTYSEADTLVTYTDWAKEVLAEVNVKAETNSPGVDINTFFPSNKKINYTGNEDMIVIGTVMRNQKRKLFPNLIEDFEKFINYCREQGNEKLANKSYLYLHTTFPDLGWPLEKLILKSNVSNRILFSYYCKNCGTVFPSLFSDSRTNCPNCHKFAAAFPSTQFGVPESVLSNIINNFDVYVQYSSLEGFGIPVIEAASCGVTPMAVDYSAMEDVVRKCKGIPLKVGQYYVESETNRNFALPDSDDFVHQLYKFLTLPEGIRKKKGFDSRKAVEKHYTWKRACNKWEEIIDNIKIKDEQKTWNSQCRAFNIDLNFLNNPNIKNLSPSEFLQLCLTNITGGILNKEKYRTYQYLKQLNYGMSLQQIGGTAAFSDLSFLGLRQQLVEYGGKQLVEELKQIAENFNHWEKVRCGLEKYDRPKFLNNIYNGK